MSYHVRRIQAAGSSSSTTTSCPFDFTVGGNYVNFTPGYINGLYPTNIFVPISIVAGTNIYVMCSCVSDGKTITSASMVTTATNPTQIPITQNLAPTAFDIQIGVIYGGLGFQVARGNITAIPTVQFIESRIPPSQGEEPFIRWWTWLVHQSC